MLEQGINHWTSYLSNNSLRVACPQLPIPTTHNLVILFLILTVNYCEKFKD